MNASVTSLSAKGDASLDSVVAGFVLGRAPASRADYVRFLLGDIHAHHSGVRCPWSITTLSHVALTFDGVLPQPTRL